MRMIGFDRLYGVLLVAAICMLSPFAWADERDSLVDDFSGAPKSFLDVDPALTDGKAFVYQVRGQAHLAKKGNPEETVIKKGDLIEAGDTVWTEKDSSVSIAFDTVLKNAVQIPMESRAIFTSIEPTNINLDNGSIYNSVGNISASGSWKVSTPSAVAAVRGTVFVIQYEKKSEAFFAATLSVPDDGHESAIEIMPSSRDNFSPFMVREGSQLKFERGVLPSASMVQSLDGEAVKQASEFNQDLKDEQSSTQMNQEQMLIDKIDSNLFSSKQKNGFERTNVVHSVPDKIIPNSGVHGLSIINAGGSTSVGGPHCGDPDDNC